MRASPSSRKVEPFLHFDTPAGYDDPLGMLLGCHRRIEKKLATLKALCVHLSDKGIDAEASVAAQGVLRYFDAPAIYHHEDEEKDLIPILERRITDSLEAEKLQSLKSLVGDDHREAERLWARIRKPLEAIGDGLLRAMPQTDVQAFTALYKRHIEAEERVIVPLASRWLRESDLMSLGRSMAARRGAPYQALAK